MPIRYEIRAVTTADHADLAELARHLDSVNLPNDPAAISRIIQKSHDSFSGTIGDPRHREYVFVLRDLTHSRAVGSSLIVGQLGRRDAPYIYFDVKKEERYSQTLDKHFIHDVLSIGYSYNGPTEIGGLVMHPDSRRVKDRLGMQISYVRFLWIAMNRGDFQDHVLAELLPPLEEDGTSHLWEAVGRRFTGMDYRDADRLSRRNKEFIRGLFPDGDIYASLLDEDARSVIGKVGPKTRGVEKLLRRIGFRYVNRVDPFDGGPHFLAPTNEISLIQGATQGTVHVVERLEAPTRQLLGVSYDGPPYLRAATVDGRIAGETMQILSEDAAHLGLTSGAAAAWLQLS